MATEGGPVYVKICGLSSIDAARTALDAGADAVGMVMSERSKRNVSAAVVQDIARFVGTAADTVLVVDRLSGRDAGRVAADAGVDVVQLHGADYTRADADDVRAAGRRLWRAMSWPEYGAAEPQPWGEELLLLDSPLAGSGVRWNLADLDRPAPAGLWLLAGGLTPSNVAEAIRSAHPGGVDVSSGVESAPGVKSHELIREFVAAARSASRL